VAIVKRRKMVDRKEIADHKSAIKLNAEAENEPLENLCLRSLSHEELITPPPLQMFAPLIWQHKKISSFIILDLKLTYKN
jgi:hypothetical protein